MKEWQIDELEEQIRPIISGYLDYIDLGNPEVSETKNRLISDLLEVIAEFIDDYTEKKGGEV